jgi:hypothetical protein
MNIINKIFPRWRVTNTRVVVCGMESGIYNKEWEEDRVLEEQTDYRGRKRYFWVYETRKVRIEPSFVEGMLNVKV